MGGYWYLVDAYSTAVEAEEEKAHLEQRLRHFLTDHPSISFAIKYVSGQYLLDLVDEDVAHEKAMDNNRSSQD